MMAVKTPFDCWWSFYGKHCPRMDKKSKCEAIFNAYPLDVQRVIYEDTRDRLKHYDDWQETTPKGKRRFMRGPHPYLKAMMWECPVDKKMIQSSGPRDTTKETIRTSQELAGLKKLRSQYAKSGLDTAAIDKQIEGLENA